MENPLYTEKYKSLTIEICNDDNCDGPNEWGDDSLFLVGNHRDFYVKPPEGISFEDVKSHYEKTHHIFGLEAYIHSGVRLALSQKGNFPDRQWDVSQLGYVFASKEEWKTRKSAECAALGLIETWNDYLAGNVYGYQVKDSEGEHIASCWGFYGDYEKSGILEQAREEAKTAYPEIKKKEKEEARREAMGYNKTLSELLESENPAIVRLAKGIKKEITK